jgi:hypothetical protein
MYEFKLSQILTHVLPHLDAGPALGLFGLCLCALRGFVCVRDGLGHLPGRAVFFGEKEKLEEVQDTAGKTG